MPYDAEGNKKKKKRKIMRKLSIGEISMVDRAAQQPATMRIMKRDESDDDVVSINPELNDKFIKFMGDMILTTAEDGHQHTVNAKDFDFVNNMRLGFSSGGSTSYNGGTSDTNHSHPWIMTPEGEILIGEENGHIHTPAEISKADKKLIDELIEEITKSAVEDGTKRVDKKETDMPDTKTAAEIQKAADEKLAKVQAELDVANKVNALGIITKAHYDKLSDEDKTVFLAKSTDEQNAEIDAIKKAAEDKNPVVYTAADGSEFRKNDDPRLVAMAKRDDKREKEMVELRKTNEDIVLRKRAEDELSNLPGSVGSHMALLKAADGITDEGERNEAHAALKAKNTSMAGAFENTGETVVLKAAAGSPEAELEELTKAYMKDHKETSFAKAQNEVLETDKGKELYAKSLN